MKEDKGGTSEVPMKNLTSEELDLIIDYIYSTRTEITKDNVQSLIKAADYLDIPSLKQKCHAEIISTVDASNCIGRCQFAKIYNFAKLEQKAECVMRTQFDSVIQKEEFRELNLDNFLDYIDDDFLEIPNEACS